MLWLGRNNAATTLFVGSSSKEGMEWFVTTDPAGVSTKEMLSATFVSGVGYFSVGTDTLILSTNGGFTWTVPTNFSGSTNMSGVFGRSIATNDNEGVITGFAGGDSFIFYNSNLAVSATIDWKRETATSTSALFGSIFATDSVGDALVCGADGTIQKRINETWVDSTIDTSITDTLFGFGKSTQGTLVCVGEGATILRSRDSGVSWVTISTGLIDIDLKAVHYSEFYQAFLALSTNGFVLISLDDGLIWNYGFWPSKTTRILNAIETSFNEIFYFGHELVSDPTKLLHLVKKSKLF